MKPPTESVRLLLACLAATLAVPQTVLCDAIWVGDTSQDWNTAANWDSDPNNPGGNFIIHTATGNFPILGANSAFTPVDVFIANGANTSGRLDHRAGSLSLNDTSANGNWFFVARGANTATATYNLADTSVSDPGVAGYGQGSGSLTVGKFFVGGAFYGGGGIGMANINTTGSITANSTQDIGGYASIALAVGSGSSGAINLQNGTIGAAGDLWVSCDGTGTVNQTGGTVNVGGWFVGSRWNGAVSTYNQSGGTVNVTGNAVGVSYGGGTGAINVSGGMFNCNDVWVSECYNGTAGTGTLTVSGTGTVNPTWWVWITRNAAAIGVVNLDGGTLATAHVVKGNGAATFNFNGGTLKAKQNDTNFIEGAVNVTVKSGGAVVDTNGYNITIQNALVGDTASTSGGLLKNGSGILILSGASTYTGTTTVHAGTLALGAGGSIANSGQIVVGDAGSSGAKLDATALSGLAIGGSQTISGIGTVDVGSGKELTVHGTLAPGNSIGTLIINGDMVLAGNSDFEIDPNGVLADLADVSGNLTYGGTLNVSNIGGAFSWGDTFNLFDWDGILEGEFTAVNLPTLDNGWVWQDNLLGDGTITVVPEPATTLGLTLLLSGALLRRRRHP